ncbi:hypothetical protein [Bradyrhizobium ottawaense]|uniref:hypothetical protein n=1 Tax=Bradyrhizobium ottawaense TaxID=931866 RepID=UPI0012FDAEF5|nr:hypothetical protein [Bradyrhizobium ottawaense]
MSNDATVTPAGWVRWVISGVKPPASASLRPAVAAMRIAVAAGTTRVRKVTEV